MALTRIAAQPNPAYTLKSELAAALAANRTIMTAADTYLAIATPTNAQVAAQVRALTQGMKILARNQIALARLVANKLEGTG